MMNRNRESLAWIVLLVSFAACIVFTISIPITVSAFVQRATRPLPIFVQTNQGTLVLDSRLPLAASDETQSVEGPASLAANTLTDRGLIQIYGVDGTLLLARVQVYGNTKLTVDEAQTPRFASSSAETNMLLSLNEGRVRITIQPNSFDTIDAQVTTPHGTFELSQAGVYDVQSLANETQVTVLEGMARLPSESDNQIVLEADQRGVLGPNATVTGPFSTERNIIKNGDFSTGLGDWVRVAWFVERNSEPTGETRVIDVFGEPTLRFSRNGVGHANTRVRQDINEDVTDFSELRLFLSYRILDHTLPVCGYKGTECPLIVKIEYVDADGRKLGWQQGIYAKDARLEADPDLYPNVCEECGSPLGINEHIQAGKFADLLVFESDNVIEQLQQEGFRPVMINNIQLITQGHSFEVDVVEIGLYAQQ